MTLNDRDRRILMILIPIVVLAAFWFLVMSPKRKDLTAARDEQHAAEQARDAAQNQAAQLEKARQTFAADYAAVVRLGKAIPAQIDAPGVLVQLDRASKGTHIDFQSVSFGERLVGAVTPPAPPTGTAGPAQPGGNAAAGGAPAVSQPGQQAENAGNAVNAGNQASANVNQQSGGATDTTVTTTATTTDQSGASTAPGALDSVPLTFNFTGTYFDLADFFHRLKRFVYVANRKVFVRGRLLSIDTLTFAPGQPSAEGVSTNSITATVGATVYLSPRAQGTTGGATPAGPPGTTTTETTTTPAGSQTSGVPLAAAGSR